MMRFLMSVTVLAALLAVAACSSPDSMDADADPTSTPSGQAQASPTEATPPPSATPESPAATPTAAIPATSTPTAPLDPTATQPAEPTQAPTETATSAPEPTVPDATPTTRTTEVWSVRQFETTEPIMVLTFDAGADRGFAGEILDILAEEGIHASFGMTGPWAEDNPDLIARIIDEGHHLINHTWSHPHMPELTTVERVDEVQSLENLMRDQHGVDMRPYFRPPFGEYDDATMADLAAIGYTINVLWTVDTLGWNGLSAVEINARVMDAAAPGAIVLMHVGAQSQDAAALPEMIRLLREQGYSFATVAEMTE